VSSASESENLFGKRVTVEQVEEGCDLAPKFDAAGLIPCVTTDHDSGEVLMVAVMNREALARTIETGEAHYWSRSRQQLWHKGATSGLVQKVVEMRIDDDQDCVWLRVELPRGLPVVLLPEGAGRCGPRAGNEPRVPRAREGL
jgi:phosphoribosyl-AMP cyclohydrolase